ncbi:MAG: hypothetical protein QXR84_05400 [Candidatus Bathyarchaeia archaeon]|nr:hypothetical protein [Candidatus Bathyarchaeota archaeon]
MGEFIKPFYFQPPWDILFDPQRLQKIDPWSINIAFLLLSFLEEMERRAIIDFRASGVALDSSALIYLLKSSLLLRPESPQPEQTNTEPTRISEVIPILLPPLRYELTTTTLQSLLEALEEALRDESSASSKISQKPVLMQPEIIPVVSAYLMEIEEKIEELLKKICMLVEKGEIITFSCLIKGQSRIEAVRTFIILLFLAHRGKIALWQHEGSDEIYITLNSGVEGQGDGINS